MAALLGFAQLPCAWAQDSGRFEFSLQAGGSFYGEKTRRINRTVFDIQTGQTFMVPATETRSLEKSARFFGSFRWFFRENQAVELSYSAGPSDVLHGSAPLDPNAPLLAFVDETHTSAHFASANYVRRFLVRERFDLFATGGVGLLWLPGNFGTRFTGNFGLGGDYHLNARASLRWEYRVFLFPQPSTLVFVGVPQARGGINYHHGPTLGVSFRF